MPAKATLFDMKCKPVFDFGTGSRNTVLWAPHGRFLVLGGFGNISGNMQFWDNNRKKMMAEVKAPGSTNYAWSPCSRFFLTATLFPRLRVDNGFKVWKYDGSLVHQEQVRSFPLVFFSLALIHSWRALICCLSPKALASRSRR